MSGRISPPHYARGDFRGAQWVGRAKVKGKHGWQRMALATVSMLGLQLVWSTEMSQASPYLLSLGLSKSLMAMVFLAGPLSGLIVQPLIGAVSVVALLAFGWTRDLAAIFARRGSGFHGALTRWLAVIAVYALDFAINVVQAADRSLLVDVLPPAAQQTANAWAGRQSGIGAILGFWISNIDLPSTPVLSFFGDSQLKILSLIAALILVATHAVTCLSVEERVLLEDDTEFDEVGRHGVVGAVKQIHRVWAHLPRPIRRICDVQFYSWIGWFPIMFFSTTWIAEIWFRAHRNADASSGGAGGGGFGEVGQDQGEADAATRAGSHAMMWHAIVAFVFAVGLPAIVPSDFDSSMPAGSGGGASGTRWNPPRSSDSSLVDAMLHSLWRVRRFLPDLPLRWLSISSLWMYSQVVFSALMLLSLFARNSLFLGTLVIGATGFSWAVSTWAPFALLGETILLDGASAKSAPIPRHPSWRSGIDRSESLPMMPTPRPSSRPEKRSNSPLPPTHRHPGGGMSQAASVDSLASSATGGFATPPTNGPGFTTPPVTGDVLELRHSDEFDDGRSRTESGATDTPRPAGGGIAGQQQQYVPVESREDEERRELDEEMDGLDGMGDEGTADSAGVILGIHNIYVTIPQLLVTFISSIVFAVLAPGHSVVPGEGDLPASEAMSLSQKRALATDDGSWDAVGLIFRLGGVASAVSAWRCYRMIKEQDRPMPTSRSRPSGF